MKIRSVVVLAGVTALLGVWLYFDRSHQPEGAGRHLLPGFDRASVHQIDITRPGSSFSLSRFSDGGAMRWRLLPAGVRADEQSITDLLAVIDFAETVRRADVTPAAVGLTPPAVTITITSGSRSPLTVRLGRPDPSEQGVYVGVEGDESVRVGPRRLLDLADREPNAFRDRRLFGGTPTSVTWELEDGKQGGIYSRPGGWQNERGEKLAAGRAADVLRRIGAIRIQSFLAAPPDARATRRLRVVADELGELVVTDDGVVVNGAAVTLQSPELLAGLWPALTAAAARDDALVSAPLETITGLELEDGPHRVRLHRQAGAWTFGEPKPPYPADTPLIDAWLKDLAKLKAPPAAKVPRSRRLVIQTRDQQVVVVPPGAPAYALLDPDPLRFRSRALLDVSPLDIRRLRRTSPGGAAVEEARRGDDQTWQPVGPALDAAKLAELVETLATLRAASFTDKPPAGRPELTIELDVGAPHEKPARHVLELYAGCRGRLDGTTGFTLDAETCAELRTDLK